MTSTKENKCWKFHAKKFIKSHVKNEKNALDNEWNNFKFITNVQMLTLGFVN